MVKMIIETNEVYPVYGLSELPDYDASPNLREPIVDITDEFKQRYDKIMGEYNKLQDELSDIADKTRFANVLDVQKQLRSEKDGEL